MEFGGNRRIVDDAQCAHCAGQADVEPAQTRDAIRFSGNDGLEIAQDDVIELQALGQAGRHDLEAFVSEVGAGRLGEHIDSLDGVLHSIGFAPQEAFDFMGASWEDVAPALQISAYSLKGLAQVCLPLMGPGGSVVGLTLDASVAWTGYDWMGVAKAAFESTSRYCARDLGPLGIRCNLVAAGPISTTAAKSIPAFATAVRYARVDHRLRRTALPRPWLCGHDDRDDRT